jgi:hypothetical protein
MEETLAKRACQAIAGALGGCSDSMCVNKGGDQRPRRYDAVRQYAGVEPWLEACSGTGAEGYLVQHSSEAPPGQ